MQDTEEEQPDWQQAIDRSFGDGPGHLPLDARLTAGRRALARRRAVSAAGAAALVAAVAVGSWAASGGPDSSALPDPAPATRSSSPSPTAQVTADDGSTDPPPLTAKARREALSTGAHAAYDGWGRLVIADGWKITERIPNPMDYELPSKSVGLAITKGGGTEWALVTLEDDGKGVVSSGTAWDPAGKSFATLQQWVADQVAIQGRPNHTPAPGAGLVTMKADGRLVGKDGAEVVQQVADPDVPGFAGAGDPTAAAEVRDGDDVWFVLARRIDGGDPEYFPVPAGVLQPKPTMDAFLHRCRLKYASGEGLR